ncbi:MAG TPA: hypothetical protein VGU72_25585 [Beijerinckiaceae bacterium]|jgi:hypothetical protein|nr:hypothetical protein [Beijerinckiaceae bacterium]
MKSKMIAMALAIGVAGCAPPVKSIFVRVDGQRLRDSPAIAAQFEIDRQICLGEAQKARLSGVTVAGGGLAGAVAEADRNNAAMDVGKGCMAEKGYVYVPEDQAAAKSEEFARIAAAQKAKPQPTNDRSRIAR